MAKLPFRTKNDLEKLFQMESGYLLDFSNSSFARFIGDTINIDIYDGVGYKEYCSKANKLRQLIENENDVVVGTVLHELLLYCRDYRRNTGNINSSDENKIDEFLEIATKMMGNGLFVDLPQNKEDTLKTLMDDIQNSLLRNQPTLVLDRLHTFSTKYLRKICENKGIEVADTKGNFYPLHSLAGMLRKQYETCAEFQSEFTVLAIQNNIQLFDKFNNIRNNQSYAHDNKVLSNIEADFAIKAMANVLVFIDKVENFHQQEISTPNEDPTFDLPF